MVEADATDHAAWNWLPFDLKRIGLLTCSIDNMRLCEIKNLQRRTEIEEEARTKQVTAWTVYHFIVSPIDNGRNLVLHFFGNGKAVILEYIVQYRSNSK